MEKELLCRQIAKGAVQSLIREATLTPKPGLVDRMDNGSHSDLTLPMMIESAHALDDTFYEMAMLCYGAVPSLSIREKFGEIGRRGEAMMFAVTGGVNTHKGAIWSLGLLSAACAMLKGKEDPELLCLKAGELARIEDHFVPKLETNGSRAVKKYGVRGAKQEAQEAFPHILSVSLPIYQRELANGEMRAALLALLGLIATLDDTCLVHRGGMEGLGYAKEYARRLLKAGNVSGMAKMNEDFIARRLSPGGSADLLAATFFIHALQQLQSTHLHVIRGV